ncbi:MAG: putative porin [Bacteroidales bacterium]
MKQILLILSIVWLFSYYVSAQEESDFERRQRELYEKEESEQLDSDEEAKEKEEALKNIPRVRKSWSVFDYGANVRLAKPDTSMAYYQLFNPPYMEQASVTEVGNYGSAAMSNNFFDRQVNTKFYFLRNFQYGTYVFEDVEFMNTTTPYTYFYYVQSLNKNTKQFDRLDVVHSQNVNERLNFLFRWDQARANGDFQNQQQKPMNVLFNMNYQGDKYIAYASVIYNSVRGEENGGLTDEASRDLTEKSDQLPVNLYDVTSGISNTIFTYNHEYRVGRKEIVEEKDVPQEQWMLIPDSVRELGVDKFFPRLGIGHQIEYETATRSFDEVKIDTGFYHNSYLNADLTNDKVEYTRLSNIVRLKYYENPDKEWLAGAFFYAGADIVTVKYNQLLNDSVPYVIDSANMYSNNFVDAFVGGEIGKSTGKFLNWNAKAKFYFSGQKLGTTYISGYLEKPLRLSFDTLELKANAEFNTIAPDVFEQDFVSNHFIWHNSFSNTTEMKLGGTLNSKRLNATAGVNYGVFTNLIYGGYNVVPVQEKDPINILSVFVQKDFETKVFDWRIKLLWQSSSNEAAVPLPDISVFSNISAKFILSKVLYTRFGVEFLYDTEFYGNAYDPATGRFYSQNTSKIGGYPYLTPYLTFRLKRFDAFFRGDNISSMFMKEERYTAYNLPSNRFTFRIGLKWRFFD